jgi:hypothetical protein
MNKTKWLGVAVGAAIILGAGGIVVGINKLRSKAASTSIAESSQQSESSETPSVSQSSATKPGTSVTVSSDPSSGTNSSSSTDYSLGSVTEPASNYVFTSCSLTNSVFRMANVGDQVSETMTFSAEDIMNNTMLTEGSVCFYLVKTGTPDYLPEVSFSEGSQISFPESERTGLLTGFQYRCTIGAKVTLTFKGTTAANFRGYLQVYACAIVGSEKYRTVESAFRLYQGDVPYPDIADSNHTYVFGGFSETMDLTYDDAATTQGFSFTPTLTVDGANYVADTNGFCWKLVFSNNPSISYYSKSTTKLTTEYYDRYEGMNQVNVYGDTVNITFPGATKAMWTGGFTISFHAYYGSGLIEGTKTITGTFKTA